MRLVDRLAKQFKTEFVGQTISVVSGAILIVILAHLLDTDDYGLLFLAISVFGVIKLFSELGIANSAAKFIAEYKETDPSQLTYILRFSLFLNITTILIICIILLISHEYLATLIGETDLQPFLLIGVVFVALDTLLNYVRKTLQGFEAIEASAVIYTTNHGSRLIFAVGLVVIGYGAIGALIGYIIAFAIACFIGFLYIYIQYIHGAEQTTREKGLRREITEYAIPLTATRTAIAFDSRIDIILVGFFINPVAVAYYTIGKQIISFIRTPLTALGFTLSPTFEAQKVKGNQRTAAKIYEEALSHSLLLYIPAAAGLMLVAEPLIRIVFGRTYLGAVPVVQVLAIHTLLQSITLMTSNTLDFLGRARKRAIAKGGTSVLNVTLNVILIPTIGVVGAALATVITYSMYTFATVYFIRREFDLRMKWLFRHISTVLGITAVMSIVVYLVIDYVTGFVTLFAVIGIGVVVWALLAFVSGVLDFHRMVSILS